MSIGWSTQPTLNLCQRLINNIRLNINSFASTVNRRVLLFGFMLGPLNRIILFVKDVPRCAAFYKDVLGLESSGYADAKWITFSAGGCLLSLHQGAAASTSRKPKYTQIVFEVADVSAARDQLLSRNVQMDKIIDGDGFAFCNGRDPEGNWFQISSR